MKKEFWLFFALLLAYFVYYFHGIGWVDFPFWDENIYINTARAILSTHKPYPTPDHPPFGKELLALGIRIFGDNPVGWRFFAVLSGAVSCTLVSYLVYRIGKNLGVALFVAALLFFEPLWVVHFRLGQLDAPLTALLLTATTLTYVFYASDRLRLWILYPTALTLGLALSTKFLTLVFMPVLGGLALARLWREEKRWKKIFHAAAVLTVLPILVLLGTYRALGYNTTEAVEEIKFIIVWHKFAQGPRPYFSRWYEWLYIRHPVWYFSKPLEGNKMQSIMATGNFVLWIGAELGTLYSLIRFWRRPEILALSAAIGLQWLLYSQKPSTYIHYMTEILPFLFILMGVAIADLFDRWGQKYRRLLQIDLAVYFMAAAIVFWNYQPFIWGKPYPKELHFRIMGISPPPPASPTPSPTAGTT